VTMPIVKKKGRGDRARARAALGPLQALGHSKARIKRHLRAAEKFYLITFSNISSTDLHSNDAVRKSMVRFIETSWAEGDGVDLAKDAIFGTAMLLEVTSKSFADAWTLIKRWERHELPSQAPPSSPEEAMALAGLAAKEGKFGLAFAVLLAFECYLRTGEWVRLVPEQVVFADRGLVVDLGETKGTARRGGKDVVSTQDPLLCHFARKALSATPPASTFVQMSESHFRRWFRKSLKALELEKSELTPYSFRRGGCSSAVLNGTPVSTVIHGARWTDARTARIYIQEGAAMLRETKRPPAVQTLLRQAAQHLHRAL
jgi:integrase